MNRHHVLPSAILLLGLSAAIQAEPASPATPTSTPAAATASAADPRGAWSFFAGRFAIEAPPAAKLQAGAVWTLAPVLGGMYLELQDQAYQTDFRLTLAWDRLRKHYAMSLLDSGSGVLDVYTGSLHQGEFLLTNDHGYRVRIQSQPDGWIWQHERSQDGAWLPSGPPLRARRVAS